MRTKQISDSTKATLRELIAEEVTRQLKNTVKPGRPRGARAKPAKPEKVKAAIGRRKLFTVVEAAKAIGLSASSVFAAVRERRIKVVRKPFEGKGPRDGRITLIPASELRRWSEQRAA